MKGILVVDNNHGWYEKLRYEFSKDEDFKIIEIPPPYSGDKAMEMLHENELSLVPDFVLLSHNISEEGQEGVSIADCLEELHPNIQIILCSPFPQCYQDFYTLCKVKHFPGRDIEEIKECLLGKCGCKEPETPVQKIRGLVERLRKDSESLDWMQVRSRRMLYLLGKYMETDQFFPGTHIDPAEACNGFDLIVEIIQKIEPVIKVMERFNKWFNVWMPDEKK